MRGIATLAVLAIVAPITTASREPDGRPAAAIVLTDTGRAVDGLPIVERSADTSPHERALARGFAARVVRLYRSVQIFVRPGSTPEPAYLVLTGNQGGFPRRGFALDGRVLRDAHYIDLHRRSAVSGRYGAVDQIFPHELLHTIVEILAGPPPSGGASQVHAIGVTTDRVTAFSEGFAEHGQIMAIEAEDALPDTHLLAADTSAYTDALARFEAYRRARSARLSIAARADMTFPLWFSGAEQVLRYHGVRDNLFAIEPDVPLPSGASYDAYLMENVLPGRAGGVPMRTGRLLAREGVVSALFYRLATSRPLQQRYQDEAFYRAFGTTRAAVDPLDNVYLKMFSAIRGGGYDAAAVVSEWKRRFPADAAEVDAVLRSVFHGQPVPDAPALWVENAAFHTGTSLFDQFRALPQAYAFDLNACSRIDLLTIPGMTRTAAAAIVEGAPYVSLDDLARRAALPPGVADTIRSYAARADRRLAQDEETALSLSLRSVLKPYAWRALEVLAAAAFVAAWLHRKARRIGWIRAGLNGIAGALCGLVAAWSVDSGSGLLTLAVPVLVFGVPAALWRAARSRSLREAGRVLATWTLSAIVPVLLTAPF